MTAVATPRCAPKPAAPNTHAVTPSRGPQPPTLGSTMAAITTNAIGSIRDGGAVTPAGRAASRKVAAWPATTSADASARRGHHITPVATVAPPPMDAADDSAG